MGTAELLSVNEYLTTSYRPDQEFLEGCLVERQMGEYDHSNLQGAVVAWMRRHQREWNIRVLPEQRIRVAPSRYRVPDVCVVSREQEIEPVFTQPPLLCIEILSKDDTLRNMQDRVDDYRSFGVRNIWVLDPVKRRAYVATQGDFREPERETLELLDSPIRIPLRDLFSELD